MIKGIWVKRETAMTNDHKLIKLRLCFNLARSLPLAPEKKKSTLNNKLKKKNKEHYIR